MEEEKEQCKLKYIFTQYSRISQSVYRPLFTPIHPHKSMINVRIFDCQVTSFSKYFRFNAKNFP